MSRGMFSPFICWFCLHRASAVQSYPTMKSFLAFSLCLSSNQSGFCGDGAKFRHLSVLSMWPLISCMLLLIIFLLLICLLLAAFLVFFAIILIACDCIYSISWLVIQSKYQVRICVHSLWWWDEQWMLCWIWDFWFELAILEAKGRNLGDHQRGWLDHQDCAIECNAVRAIVQARWGMPSWETGRCC